jgi:hypothetical protein
MMMTMSKTMIRAMMMMIPWNAVDEKEREKPPSRRRRRHPKWMMNE